MKVLKPEERLIVAADFKPTREDHYSDRNGWRRRGVREFVLKLADSLKGTGVYLKVNSALRACGYGLIDEIHECGLKVFADLKLDDIPETLETDAVILGEAHPELVTVMCHVGKKGLERLRKSLTATELLGVTILTSLDEEEVAKLHGLNINQAVKMLCGLAEEAGLDGLICSPKELGTFRSFLTRGMTLNTPAIRPSWSIIAGDDQNPDRVMTPKKAIMEGADRIVVGRPIVQAENPRDAVMRTIEEIASAMP